ncbi:MAG: gamma-glutamylcyclotransferase [Kiritimatiellae bacterium]|nr:gamma-glutamylcyclotransferase [Kiritimatiellia bacterium]
MNIGDTAKPNTNPEDSSETILRLFVYGTLKLGYWNQQRFCAQARSIEPAVVWGRLYHLHAGFPALEVPEGLILARGSADPLADARRQQEIGTPRFGRPTGDWDLIHGELVTFNDPLRDLPPIDRLEAFVPNGRCVYKRVLVAVESNDLIRPVWLYHYIPGHNADRITSGKWRLKCRNGIFAKQG